MSRKTSMKTPRGAEQTYSKGDGICRALLGRLGTSESRLQISHRCLQLWLEHVATAPYQSHPAFVTAERNCCPPATRSRSPRQDLGSESSMTWPKSSHLLLPRSLPLFREQAKKSGPVQRVSSELPCREGAGHVQSPSPPPVL